MAQHRDDPTDTQLPDDPMGFGGEPRKPGYGKYPGTDPDPSEAREGVPGAHGDPEGKSIVPHEVPKGDLVNEEMDIVEPSKTPGRRQAYHGGGKDHGPS